MVKRLELLFLSKVPMFGALGEFELHHTHKSASMDHSLPRQSLHQYDKQNHPRSQHLLYYSKICQYHHFYLDCRLHKLIITQCASEGFYTCSTNLCFNDTEHGRMIQSTVGTNLYIIFLMQMNKGSKVQTAEVSPMAAA